LVGEARGSEKPAQLVHARGKAERLRWSPDASKLAFVSAREDHSFIGVYDLAQKSVRYLDPSVDRDQEPVWSSDSRQIAYLRLPARPEPHLFGPERSGAPWSIRVAAVETGAGREVWRAREGQGSVFHSVVAQQQLLWTADDRLVFPWEGDGWTHLYSVPLSGGAASLMTRVSSKSNTSRWRPAVARCCSIPIRRIPTGGICGENRRATRGPRG